MDFTKKTMALLLLVAPGITNVLSILPKPTWQLVWVKPGLKRRSTKSVYQNIISKLKLQDRYDYRKYFRINSENHFFHILPSVQLNLTFFFWKKFYFHFFTYLIFYSNHFYICRLAITKLWWSVNYFVMNK